MTPAAANLARLDLILAPDRYSGKAEAADTGPDLGTRAPVKGWSPHGSSHSVSSYT